MPGITIGADLGYHLAASLIDPDYHAGASAAASAAGLAEGLDLSTHQSNDVWSAGIAF